MNALTKWMEKATPTQQRRLAKLARTTIGTLRQISGGYRDTRVNAELAIRIDQAAAILRKRDDTAHLPDIPREALARACSRCEFAKRCRKA